ncbi:MAG: sulfatase-like hydrolase/transferase [Bacteroidota bacterium]
MLIRYSLILALPLMVLSGCHADRSLVKDTSPNILFLFTDDQTFASIHHLGNLEVSTPNLDRLSQMGTTFTHAYNMGGYHGAVCVASRSMLISGQSVWRARAIEPIWKANDSSALSQTWPQLMQRQGYRTYMAGKWHVQAKADSIFQMVGTERPGMPPDSWIKMGGTARKEMYGRIKKGAAFDQEMPVEYSRPMSPQDQDWLPWDTLQGGFWEGGQHWSEKLRDEAIGFIKDAEQHLDPFFMYIAFNAPHDPRQAPQSFVDQYVVDDIKTPPNYLAEYPYKEAIGCGVNLRDEGLAPFPRTEYAIKKHRQEYYALITHLDEQIGHILDALEASGKMEDTYIIFTSDHGLAVGQHGLLGKQNLYDHSMRVPFIIAGKNIPQDHKIDTDIYLQDAMATTLDLAGIEKPDYIEFNSVLPLIDDNKNVGSYPAIYGTYMDYQRMIRKNGYKMILYPEVPMVRLYHLDSDPLEKQDIANQEDMEELKKEMFADLLNLQENFGDTLKLVRYFPDLARADL